MSDRCEMLNKKCLPFDSALHVGRPNIGDKEEFLALAGEIFDRRWLTNNGPLVQEFEAQVADYLGVSHCIAMCNGTVALEIAIRALGLSGEVIVPSYTFVATAHALFWQGITPVFADIDPLTHNLDPEAVRRMITPKTTGIIGVHLWGRPAPVEELSAVAEEHNLQLMFDAAHAFGCSYQGKMIGSFGRAEVFSFHATKFFNTFEGGAVVTDDEELAKAMRLMRNFGFSGYDNVIHPGTNGKMTEICAAMGLVNFKLIKDVVASNKRNYELYSSLLNEIPGIIVNPYAHSEISNYQYLVIEIDDECNASRDEIITQLHSANVLARKYFWPGCHRMQPYSELFPHSHLMLEQTERLAARVIVLPTGPTLDGDKIEKVAGIIREVTR